MLFPNVKHSMCLFTDASDHFWSSILVQTEDNNMDLPVPEGATSPWYYCQRRLKNSAINWSVPEKEGFDIVEVMTKLDYLTIGRLV